MIIIQKNRNYYSFKRPALAQEIKIKQKEKENRLIKRKLQLPGV